MAASLLVLLSRFCSSLTFDSYTPQSAQEGKPKTNKRTRKKNKKGKRTKKRTIRKKEIRKRKKGASKRPKNEKRTKKRKRRKADCNNTDCWPQCNNCTLVKKVHSFPSSLFFLARLAVYSHTIQTRFASSVRKLRKRTLTMKCSGASCWSAARRARLRPKRRPPTCSTVSSRKLQPSTSLQP